jgi:hypothetical protein
MEGWKGVPSCSSREYPGYQHSASAYPLSLLTFPSRGRDTPRGSAPTLHDGIIIHRSLSGLLRMTKPVTCIDPSNDGHGRSIVELIAAVLQYQVTFAFSRNCVSAGFDNTYVIALPNTKPLSRDGEYNILLVQRVLDRHKRSLIHSLLWGPYRGKRQA